MRRCLVLLVPVLALLPACGGDDDPAGEQAADQAQVLPVEITEPSPNQYRFNAPGSVRSGLVTMEFKNSGSKLHTGQLWRVDGTRTAAEVVAGAYRPNLGEARPEWLHAEGGPGSIGPGRTASVTMVLQPGDYFLLDGTLDENARSFAQLGAVHALRVSGDKRDARLPAAANEVVSREFIYDVPRLTAGQVALTYRNAGSEPHHLAFAPVPDGQPFEAVRQFLSEARPPAQRTGPPPLNLEAATSTAVLDSGGALYTVFTLQKGRYAFFCYARNRQGGPFHTTLGMVQEVIVA